MVRRLWRGLTLRNLAVAAVLASCVVLVVGAVTGPPGRGNSSYRTAPVLRAMGVPDEDLKRTTAAWADVPSLSVSPRFVLPLVRDDSKRHLVAPPPVMVAALPAPAPITPLVSPDPPPVPLPEPPPQLAVEPVRQVPAAAVAMLAPPSRPTVAIPPPPSRPQPAPGMLTTAVVMTPLIPPRSLPRPASTPMLAIVIDDLGPAQGLTRRAIGLPVPVTLSFLPYADGLDVLTAAAQRRGHEIFLHLPMEPIGTPNPGPNAILVSLQPDELEHRLAWAFDRLPRATGFNNHMGSRATADPTIMLKVLQEAERRGLSFVDSRTSPLSVGDALAARLGVPHVARDVFLDNDTSSAAILRQLAEAERDARHRGHALAIGHPYPTTLSVLESWLPAAEARGLRIVTAGQLIARSNCHQPEALTVSACSGGDCPLAKSC